MPGVVVTTETQAGAGATITTQSSQVFMVGLLERGSITKPIVVNGMSDVRNKLGSRVSYGAIWDQLKVFFDEGGLQAVVSRIVGPDPTVGNLTLNDRADPAQPTLRVDAANPGSWSTQTTVEVLDGSLANTFRIRVSLNGNVVRDVNNLSSPAAAVNAFKDNEYVRITDLGSATAGPSNNPAIITATALSAGDDDRANIVTEDYIAGLAKFTSDYGDGAVAIPGQTSDTVWAGIEAHCRQFNRIGLLSGDEGDDSAGLLARNQELDSEFVGIFAPWVVVPAEAGGTRTISPEGYVAACRSRAHNQVGPWKVPAGEIAKAETLVDIETRFTEAEADALDDGRINIIRVIAGTVRLYGWRSMSNDVENYAYLKDRDLLNYLVVQADRTLEQFVFRTIDRKGHLLSEVNAALVGLVDPIAQGGGLFARLNSDNQIIDPGYAVNTGSDINTPQTMANNEIHARLLVRIAPVGSLISLTIVKVGILSGL